ncbi:hypothetical protein [Roseateles agri]|nr:hypothetical protein [Paucibacter sp. R3-3]
MLAELELPKTAIPESVRLNARSPHIYTSRTQAPHGAIWISCCYATPHVDKSTLWNHKLFLTVSVVSKHMAGDALAPHPQEAVPVGRLFVVDPLVAHWLFDESAWERKATRSWIGLQWEVDRDQAAQKANELVSQFNGRWLQLDDERYKNWRH